MKQWGAFSVQIARVINNKPIIQIQTSLVDRLRERCSVLVRVTEASPRLKFMNFEFLTKQFLFMEKRPDLASFFHPHKTPSVLLQAEKMLHIACAKLNKNNNNKFEWFVTFNDLVL
jgi:hypothetical protein